MVSSGYNRIEDKMSMNMYNDLVFKKKSMRIDWRKIAAVDLDRIAREMDVIALQENIDHLTFCNIDSELDTRVMDPTYIKLFKMSQFTIEYLMHSQNYLTDIITAVESQLNKSHSDTEKYKSMSDKLQKDLADIKKENKKRKKMIETQQGLMTANTSNYHHCQYCSKVFLNVNYLQAHMTRRHPENDIVIKKQNSEIEKELERIKERLKNTETDLAQERSARLTGMSNAIMPSKGSSGSESPAELIKQMDQIKNAELKKQRDEFKRASDGFKSELKELSGKNVAFEREIKELQEKLGKKSNVGWMKDDIDMEKDAAIKQKQEIERLNLLLEDYEKQVDDMKSKWNVKEAAMKKKHLKELTDRDDEIAALKAKLAEFQNSVGKTDDQLLTRLDELQNQLQQDRKLIAELEAEIADLKSQPPPVTPRQQQAPAVMNRSLSPVKQPSVPEPEPIEQEAPVKKAPVQKPERPQTKPTTDTMQSTATFTQQEISTYLPDYCPLTYKAVQSNPNTLLKFKEAAVKYFHEELDQLGIDPADKALSTNDYNQKSNDLKVFRQETGEQLPNFDEIRSGFANICNRYVNQKLNSSLRSTGNRVTFKQDLVQAGKELPTVSRYQQQQQQQQHQNQLQRSNQYSESSMYETSMTKESEETDDDVSLSNALESNDDDTEPTKSLVTENLTKSPSPRKQKQQQQQPVAYHQDEISDLETISQLLTDRSGSRRKSAGGKHSPTKQHSTSKIDENKRKIEAQLERDYAKGSKPSPNAVPVMGNGFKPTASRLSNQDTKNESYTSISDLDEDGSKRPKSGLKSTMSESSSYWISETHESQINKNNQMNHKHDQPDRPGTANSLKTSNFDSDEETVNVN